MPMVALADIGFFARYTLDHRAASSGHDYRIASDLVDWAYLAETFRKVTGSKAEVIYQTYDDWTPSRASTARWRTSARRATGRRRGRRTSGAGSICTATT